MLQVQAAADRVRALRAEVPALVTQAVQQQLEGLRPVVASMEALSAEQPINSPQQAAEPAGGHCWCVNGCSADLLSADMLC